MSIVPTKAIFCNCSYRQLTPLETRRAVLGALEATGCELVVVQDLCEATARGDERLKTFADSAGLLIAACHARAVRWLASAAGGKEVGCDATVLDMRGESADALLARISGGGADSAPVEPPAEPPGPWMPWFPVIDYERCHDCGQCKDFCLFGVYAATADGRVAVRNPQNCKTDCPACARICPAVAIIFPKYADAPINGGVVEDEAAEQLRVKVDLKRILGDDPYAALAARKLKKATGVPLFKKPDTPR